MATRNVHLHLNNSRWHADTPLAQHFLPSNLKPWLCEQGSLTAKLMGIANGTFQVRVLSQRIARPHWHEQIKLGQAQHQAALVREVNLDIHGQAVVFARSIIPLSLAKRGGGGLATLGTVPLGHLLFKDGRIRVSRREFAQIENAGPNVHARRTPYEYLGETILVTECFLPSLEARR